MSDKPKQDARPTGDAEDAAGGGPTRETRREKARPIDRTALDGAPGIPAEGRQDLDAVLRTPDSDLGGAVAADTTPTGATEDKPDEATVREEDRGRHTL